MKVQPYLAFNGNCKDALQFYKSILGGSIENEQKYSDVDIDIPDGFQHKLQHAELKNKDFCIMAYDATPDTPLTNGTNINMSLDIDSKEQAKAVFEKLSSSGKVHTPFQEMSWDAFYGRCSDKYNISWMVNYKKN